MLAGLASRRCQTAPRRSPVDNLVLQRRHRARALFYVRGRYAGVTGVPSPLMQISEVSVKVCFVGPPSQAINAGGASRGKKKFTALLHHIILAWDGVLRTQVKRHSR